MKVRDLLNFGGLINSTVIAGADGLDREVRTVSVLEVTEPTNGRWFLENQISVTAFYAVKDNVKAQRELIKEFNQSGGSGLIICHFDFWLKKFDESVIKLCDELNFPLITVPSDISYIDIILPINDRLLKIHSEKYKYSLELQGNLIEMIIENKNIHDIAKYIFNISGKGIAIFDVDSKLMSSESIQEEYIESLSSYCKTSMGEYKSDIDEHNLMIKEIDNRIFIIQPVVTGNDFYGSIAMEWGTENPYSYKEPRLIVKYASIAVALISTKKQRIQKMQDIYFRDYLADLLTWNFKNEQTAILRGRTLGWDIENKCMMIMLNINSSFIEPINYKQEDIVEEYANRILIPIVNEVVKQENTNNLVGIRSDNILVLLENDNSIGNVYHRAKTISENLLDRVPQDELLSVSIGISNYFENVSDISNAHKQAMEAVLIGRNTYGIGKAFTYLELGYLPLLKGSIDDSKLKGIHEYYLGPLIKYDQENNTELFMTLRNLLFFDLSISDLADYMFIHRNTLLARRRKIIELLKHNPFEMPYKFNYLMLYSSEDK